MVYFSGFCLQNESELFDFWIEKSDFSVVGFSYGAIKAVEYCLNSNKRVDRLILLSPAIFNNRDEKYKKMQTIFFTKDKNRYIKNFFANATKNSKINIDKYFKLGTKEELKELLYYNWSLEKLKKIKKKGVIIEVILGENDLITDAIYAKDFFQKEAIVYFIKNANHFLKVGE